MYSNYNKKAYLGQLRIGGLHKNGRIKSVIIHKDKKQLIYTNPGGIMRR